MYPWMNTAFEQIKAMKDNHKMPHALLITGEKKIGKLFFALETIKYLIDNDKVTQILNQDNPDEMSEKELLIRRSNYQNLIYCHKELAKTGKPASKLSVNQIKKFCETLQKTADELQIGILYYADEMSISANNSLLKTLEEPRKNTLIIILAHKIENVLVTIRSRCSHIHIANSESQETIAFLEKTHPQAEVVKLLKLSYGVPLQVKEWLENGTEMTLMQYHKKWLQLANNPSEIKNLDVFKDKELEALIYLQNLLMQNLKKSEDLTAIFAKADKKHIFNLLKDINKVIFLFETQANKQLLFNTICILWSHITHLQTYPKILE